MLQEQKDSSSRFLTPWFAFVPLLFSLHCIILGHGSHLCCLNIPLVCFLLTRRLFGLFFLLDCSVSPCSTSFRSALRLWFQVCFVSLYSALLIPAFWALSSCFTVYIPALPLFRVLSFFVSTKIRICYYFYSLAPVFVNEPLSLYLLIVFDDRLALNTWALHFTAFWPPSRHLTTWISTCQLFRFPNEKFSSYFLDCRLADPRLLHHTKFNHPKFVQVFKSSNLQWK